MILTLGFAFAFLDLLLAPCILCFGTGGSCKLCAKTLRLMKILAGKKTELNETKMK
jgi:hypothetical protein